MRSSRPTTRQDVLVRVEPQDEAQSSRRVHPFLRDLSVTLAAQVGVALSGLLLYRLLAIHKGTDGFASYSLVKQSAGFLFPVVTVGLVGGLPRYLALPRGERSPSSEAYVAAAALIIGTVTAIVALVAIVLSSQTAALLFGDSSREDLVWPFAALMAATSMFYVAYGYYRGLLRLRAAALLQVGGMAAIPPLVVLAFPDEPVDTLILRIAAITAALSLVAVGGPLLHAFRAAHRRRVEAAGRSLWDYGHRRVPGELAQLGLFVLVPVLAAHVGTLTDVAYITAGQQVLSMLSLAVLPLGLILLPSLAKMWEEDRERTSGYVAMLAAFACHVALFLSLQAVLFADIAVSLWLGPEFDDAASVVRVTVSPAALFVVYIMLRATLDAVAVKSYNSRNNLIAFAVLAVVAAVMLGLDVARPVMCVAWAFAAGVATQGILTFLTVHHLFGLKSGGYDLALALPLAALTAALGLAARPLIDDSSAALVLLLVLELALAAIFFGVLFWRRAPWTQMLANQLFRRQ
jgi:O-antigen/teichoic acid export membrane protein